MPSRAPFPWSSPSAPSPGSCCSAGRPIGTRSMPTRHSSLGMHGTTGFGRGDPIWLAACVPEIHNSGKRLGPEVARPSGPRSEEHTSELQSLMRISYAVLCFKKTKNTHTQCTHEYEIQYQ